jgi:hypothetical protein
MSEDKKKHPSFAGDRPAAVDHVNPPKPATPVPEQKRKADHFDRNRIEALDHHNLPVAKSDAAAGLEKSGALPGKAK